MLPRDTVKEIVAYLKTFAYRLICKQWSTVWNHEALINVMVKKDDTRYLNMILLEDIRAPELLKQYTYGGANWMTALRNLGLIKMGKIQEIICAINLENKEVINKYADDLPELLPLLSSKVLGCLWKKAPKDHLVVTNRNYFGDLCEEYLLPITTHKGLKREIKFLKRKETGFCGKKITIREGLKIECRKKTCDYALCKEHLEQTISDLNKDNYGFLSSNWERRKIRCLINFKEKVYCHGHIVCRENSYYYIRQILWVK